MKKDKGKKFEKRKPIYFFVRYVLLLAISFFIFYKGFFYNLFLNLTIYPVNFLLGFFYNPQITNNLIIIDYLTIEIIPACVAISAYFLLFILNMTTAMTIKKRTYSLLFSFFCLLLLNILRIFILSVMLLNGSNYFDIVHKVLWYFLSIILVVCVWFLTAYIFKIKEIPIYADIKYLLKRFSN